MTETGRKSGLVKRRKQNIRQFSLTLSASEGLVLLLSALLLWFALRDPTAAADAARTGLSLCARSVIPSLFPFLVLSAGLVSSGAGERIGALLSRPMHALLGVSGNGASALLIGAFCGFPVGARVIAVLYERNAVSASEAERLLALSNGPSFAFLFSAVGAGFFGDAPFGLTLYGVSVASSLLIGIVLRLVCGVCDSPEPLAESLQKPPHGSALFVASVKDAGQTALTVTAFVVFFSVLSDALTALLYAVRAPAELSLALSGLLELSRGTKNAAETVGGLCGRVLCGFFAGWGGLCAHLQVIATAERPLPDRARRKNLSFRSYFIVKFMQGLLSALLLWIVLQIR